MSKYREFLSPQPDLSGRPVPWRSARPYLFAYDITEPKRSRLVLKCLRRWRIDGQLSVHETFLSPVQAEELAIELLETVDPYTDRLLLGRLSQRGVAPVFSISRLEPRPPVLGQPAGGRPLRFQTGWYLLAYDIRDAGRLRQVHKVSSRICTFLQRSVYLYHGSGHKLAQLLEILGDVIVHGVDDVRLYIVQDASQLWFVCGPKPPLPSLSGGGSRNGRCRPDEPFIRSRED